MRLLRALLAALLSTPLIAAALPGGQAVISTEQVRAELVAHAPQGVLPGQPLWLGLVLEHQPHWHTYWKNPGDSGLPTTLAWTLPAGFKAGEIDWPTPSRLPIGPLMNHGYEGRLLLPVKVEVPAGYAGDTLSVKLRADWLVCKDVCIPEGGDFALDIPARSAFAAHGADFEAAFAARPRTLAETKASATIGHDGLALEVAGLPAAWAGKAIEFFPEAPGVLDNALPRQAAWDGARWRVRVPLSDQRVDAPARMDAVLVAAGAKAGVRVGFDIAGSWPAPGSTPAPAGVAAPSAAGSAAPLGLGLALLFALIGGAILNLMPCVFPVLSMKALALAKKGGGDLAGARAGGFAYTAGVVLSFLALGGALVALRGAGEAVGWGFQLQSPLVVAALALVFFAIGLNLMGVFEVGTRLQTAAIFTALTQPVPVALTIFAALGLGMAAPYLALTLSPGLVRLMPKPGLWMVRLGINRALWLFGIVQLVSIFGFAWLASLGPNQAVGPAQLAQLALVIGFEALGVGLGTAAFVAFIARATNPLYTATQYALFSSLAAVPRTLINSGAGYLVEQMGWFAFFLVCVTLAVPGMLLLIRVAPWRGDDT
jgi:thiol:disulfide interchange protein DsbD